MNLDNDSWESRCVICRRKAKATDLLANDVCRHCSYSHSSSSLNLIRAVYSLTESMRDLSAAIEKLTRVKEK